MQLLNLLINFLFHPQCLSSSIQREWSEEAGGLRTRITKARTQSLELQFLGCQEKAKRTSFSKLCKPFSFSKSGCQLKKSVLSYLVSVMKMGSQRHWKIMGNFFLYCEMIFRELIRPQLTYTHSVPSLGESSRTLVAIVWTNCISTTISTSCLQSFALIDICDVKTHVVLSIQFSPAWIMEKLSRALLYWQTAKMMKCRWG